MLEFDSVHTENLKDLRQFKSWVNSLLFSGTVYIVKQDRACMIKCHVVKN